MGYGATFGILGGAWPLAPPPLNPPMVTSSITCRPIYQREHTAVIIKQKPNLVERQNVERHA